MKPTTKNDFIADRWIRRAKAGDAAPKSWIDGHGLLRKSPLSDDSLRDKKYNSVCKSNPRKKNISRGSAVRTMSADYSERVINYKGQFKGYRGSEFICHYQSCVVVSMTGACAWLVQDNVLVRKIIAPSGMVWDVDGLGALLRRKTDWMDYHPDVTDLRSKRLVSIVREQMAANYRRRVEVRRLAVLDKIRDREIGSCRVTLEDSRRAGNCVEGSIRFAVGRLGVTREDIVGAGHLFSVAAKSLLDLGEPRAKAAALVAWNRETTVQI